MVGPNEKPNSGGGVKGTKGGGGKGTTPSGSKSDGKTVDSTSTDNII